MMNNIILAVLLGCSAIPHSSLSVIVDKETWSGATHWPGPERSVQFFFREPGGRTNCTELDAVLASAYKGASSRFLKIGEACGRLTVVYRDDDFLRRPTEERINFVADHESFHLFAQAYGAGLPLELMQSPNWSLQAGDSFFKLTRETLENTKSTKKNSFCRIAANYAEFRNSKHFQDMDRIVYLEWPAEFYAYSQHIKRGGTEESYIAMRKALGDFDSYYSGVLIGKYLLGIDDNWAEKLYSGLSMMDMVSMNCDSSYEPRPRMLFKTSSMRLL